MVIKEFPCENRRQAETEEDKVMREMRSILNSKRAYVSTEERQEYLREYRLEHREKSKQYRLENHDKLKEQNKSYYNENKDILNKKIECQCGGKHTHMSKKRHFKSIKHQDFLKNNP